MNLFKITQLFAAAALCTLVNMPAVAGAPAHTAELATPSGTNGTLVELAERQDSCSVTGGNCPILIGSSIVGTAVWTSGDTRCDGIFIKFGSGNFCGIEFTLWDQPGIFTIEGCGGPLWATLNGGFYANCPSFSESPACGVTTKYRCA
ncbi:hypothetical protein FB451DRAFT_1178645 [Mycena latifolia]|nr:hypothetical protein FB451DRAFT_1178645 [Mycena latifolia]